MKFKIALLLAGIIWGCLFLIKLQYHRRTTLRVLQNHDNSLQYIFETLPQNTQKRPHILFIVADDLGFNDVGYHGSEIKTPNIDKLALSGVRLENYYVQPVCTPTRGQLLSGRYQIHTGLHWVLWPSTRSGLPLDNPTIADKLRAAGYSTHMIGKWHLGFYKPDFLPINRGFDTFFGFLSGHSDYYTHETGNWWGKFMTGYDLMDNDQPANITRYNGSYSTHLFASKAKDIIWGHNYEKPMFIYLSFQAVHAPLQVPENYMKQYANITDIKRRQFAGMVTCMDDAIGSIVDALKKRELWKDTLLIFSTDNGANPNAGGSNWPLKGAKGSYWEGGIRAVGFVYSLLLKMKNGYVSKSLMHVTDWFPTLLNLAKGDLNGTKMLDGYNQWKTIK
ncbi:arylsulfatase J-like [Mercenaria mercenaria]|uniref:arylsulfatase J-like n=1 Tax=Mercenaria mercenaria TaxID=6596 RepID=UPI00234F48CE|nr:arylsulfatase J-like [Mercenaria mercenaria]